METAAESIRALRVQSGQRNYEFKASHLLRTRSRSEIADFLGPSGPVHGRARVHLTDKSCFVLGRVLDLFVGGSVDAASLGLRPDPRLARIASSLCRTGPLTFGREPWQAFLAASNTVLQVRHHPRVHAPVDAFFDQLDVLRGLDGASPIFDELSDVRPDAYAARARLMQDHVLQPVLEPLIPAIARTVLHWSGGLHPVAIVHDEQSALTERRIRLMEQTLAAPPLELIRLPARGRFIELRQVDSRADPRVQVADLLAGVARRVAAEELLGRRDPDLAELLAPYVDPASRWRVPISPAVPPPRSAWRSRPRRSRSTPS
jgi:hypothetical protein